MTEGIISFIIAMFGTYTILDIVKGKKKEK